MMELLTQFLLALFATLGFSVIFRVPVKKIPACIAIGGLGWLTYLNAVYYLSSPAFGCFAGACMVGLLSSVCARWLKETATVFIIPGILCLVPGSKIYQTMEALLQHDYENTAAIGTTTLLMAGAIAIGLLVSGIIVGLIRIIYRWIRTLAEKI